MDRPGPHPVEEYIGIAGGAGRAAEPFEPLRAFRNVWPGNRSAKTSRAADARRVATRR